MAYLAQDITRPETATKSVPIETYPELALIHLITTAIENGQQTKLLNQLKQLPIGAIDRKHSDTLIVMLLVQAWKFGRAELIPIILDAWQVVYPKEEKIPFYVQLSLMPLLEIEILSYIYIKGLITRGVTYFGIMTDLINNHEFNVVIACDRVTQAFGKINYDMLKNLQNIAHEENNAMVFNFLSSKLRKLAPYQEIPSWVLDFRFSARGEITPDHLLPTYQDTLYLPSDLKITIPPDSTLIDMFNRGLFETDLSLADFMAKLQTMSPEDKFETFLPALERQTYVSRHRDTILFRLYGPAILSMNPGVDELKYGGQRMFISIINSEPDLEDIVEVQDWFVDSCDLCMKRIARRWHAVRLPVPSGGWRGCYCSWGCVRRGMATPVAFDGIPNTDVLTRALVDQIERDINKIGIQDRQDNGNIIPLDIFDAITEPDGVY